ncbi:MAG: SAVED domain-containing protein [Patulibacter sp.]|nr:SAVED domain-containing protein [Patulibacter sp.]
MTPQASASGARLSGDTYQHLYSWLEALRLLREDDDVVEIRMEVSDNGFVDDLEVARRNGPSTYHQIKFVVDQRVPLTHLWFTTAAPGKRSPLQRFYASWQRLSTAEHSAELALVTRRQPDPEDPLLRMISGKRDTLDRAFNLAESSEGGKVLTEWGRHLGVERDELERFLRQLAIISGEESTRRLTETCGWAMSGLGYRWSVDGVDAAVGAIRDLIEDGDTTLDSEKLRQILSRDVFKAQEPRASLVVEAIDTHHYADDATAAVNWIELFEGDEARSRRQLKDPDDWNRRLRPELLAATSRVHASGFAEVDVLGAMRLSSFFATGCALPETKRLALHVPVIGGESWASSAQEAPFEMTVDAISIGAGTDVAIGVSVSGDLATDALGYLRDANLQVDRFLNVKPTDGQGHRAIPDAGSAVTAARFVVDAARAADVPRGGTLHLFLFCPAAVALFAGHLWNRVPTTQLYDDLGSGTPAYAPTFLIPA